VSDKKTVLFLGKKDDWHTERALRFLRMHFDVTEYLGDWGDYKPWDRYAMSWEFDYIISYLSRWVVPAHILKKTREANINFHPAPPEYPGIGCVNFALYDNASEYGVTCHHMEPDVDTGKIIAVEETPIFKNETVETLLDRTYDIQLSLFYWVIGEIVNGGDVLWRDIGSRWGRKPYTRNEFDALGIIKMSMSIGEARRRIRAVTYKQWGPRIEIDGVPFRLEGL